MKTTLEILEEARDLIRDEKNWCQGSLDGRALGRPDARCAMGALKLALESGHECVSYYQVMCYPAVATLELCGGFPGVAYFNDTHTHAEVLELFNLAIANEMSKQNAEQPPSEPVLSGAC